MITVTEDTDGTVHMWSYGLGQVRGHVSLLVSCSPVNTFQYLTPEHWPCFPECLARQQFEAYLNLKRNKKPSLNKMSAIRYTLPILTVEIWRVQHYSYSFSIFSWDVDAWFMFHRLENFQSKVWDGILYSILVEVPLLDNPGRNGVADVWVTTDDQCRNIYRGSDTNETQHTSTSGLWEPGSTWPGCSGPWGQSGVGRGPVSVLRISVTW